MGSIKVVEVSISFDSDTHPLDPYLLKKRNGPFCRIALKSVRQGLGSVSADDGVPMGSNHSVHPRTRWTVCDAMR